MKGGASIRLCIPPRRSSMALLPAGGDSLYKYATAGGLALLVASCSLEVETFNSLFRAGFEKDREVQAALLEAGWRIARANELRQTYPEMSKAMGRFITTDDPEWFQRLSTRDLQPSECTRNGDARIGPAKIPCSAIAEMRQLEKEHQHWLITWKARASDAKKLSIASLVGLLGGLVGSLLGLFLFLAGLFFWYRSYQLPHDLRVVQELSDRFDEPNSKRAPSKE